MPPELIALLVGIVASLAIFFGCLGLITVGWATPLGLHAEQRVQLLAVGAAKIGFWIGLLSYGLVRLIRRRG